MINQKNQDRDGKDFFEALLRAQASGSDECSSRPVEIFRTEFVGQGVTEEQEDRFFISKMKSVDPQYLAELLERHGLGSAGPITSSLLALYAYDAGLRTPDFVNTLRQICNLFWVSSSDLDVSSLSPQQAFEMIRDNLKRHPEQRFRALARGVLGEEEV